MQGKPEQRVVAGRWSLPQSPGPPPARAAPSTVLPAAVALRRAVTEQRGRWGGAESGLGLGGGRNGTAHRWELLPPPQPARALLPHLCSELGYQC